MKVTSTAKLKPEIKEHLIKSYEEIDFTFFKNMSEARGSLTETDILITYGEDLTPEIVAEMKRVKWMMVISAGVEKMPFASLKERNIIVTNAKGIHKTPMAEYTMAMMLQIARKTKELIESEQNQIWDRRLPMLELNNQTLGVLGTGAIGSEIARYAKVFNMKTIGFNRSGRKVDGFDEIVSMNEIERLLSSSVYVVCVLPSTTETNGMLNEKLFLMMKKSATFINIGRGKTVVENDLMKILNENNIYHAVLDVFEQEPLPTSHPFWTMKNVTVTPHISGISALYQPRAIAIFEANLQLFLKGDQQLLNMVDLNREY